MNDRESRIQFDMNYCQHYNPKPGMTANYCEKGMDIPSLRIEKGGGKPCIRGHELLDPTSVCPHWIRRTRESGEKRADGIEKMLQRMKLVMPVVSEWRKKLPFGKPEVIECPICKGRLHLSQSSYNGHVHGRCETKDCTSWME